MAPNARDIGPDSELRKSSGVHQSARKGKDRLLSPRGAETIRYPDKLKAENHLPLPFIHQGHSVKGKKATADEELVKHMSNLPAYLQRIDRGENFQEKVLNVGVLDWTRLEKWKLNQKADVKRGGNVTPSSTMVNKSSNITNGSSALPIKSSAGRSDTKGPLKSLPAGSFHKDGSSQYLKPANSKVGRSQDSARVPKIYSGRDKKIPPPSRSSGRSSAQLRVEERQKRKGLSQEVDLPTVQSSAPVKRAMKLCKTDIQKRDREGMGISEVGESSFSKSASYGEEISPFEDETKERVDKLEESATEVSGQPHHRKQKSIVLLLPKRFPPSSIPDMLMKNERRMTSAPCSTEPNRSSFSDSFSSGDLHSGKVFSEIPRSCPLPSPVETKSETTSPSLEQTSDAPSTPPSELHGFRSFKYARRRGSNSDAASLDLAADLKIENQESPEPDGSGSRNPSPNRRFSFSLGRMARSFSFKETTSVPQLGPTYVSAKSGPVTSHDAPRGDISNQERANPSTKGRSSPLRRLLDPLLKSKSVSSRHSAEITRPLKPVNPNGPILHEKHEKSTVQALLQLTLKNGNPLFKFVVDNSSDVLAATVSNSVSARKRGSFRSCTFYSVNEVKKKGISWIGQGNKTKGADFVYNVVGQMKLSNNPFCDWTTKSLDKQSVTTECVLFDVDSRQAVTQAANSISNRELAAIVFKLSSSDNGDPNSVTVILPGGVHGLPEKGEPSPLIDRWITGGSCDCGGWDVGCKLHVLSNKNDCRKNTKTSKVSSTTDHLELFAQMEAQPERPLFSLTPFRKGIYSIEFDSSISLLQAFSICVAFLSCQGSPDTPEANPLSADKQEPTRSRNGALKSPMIFQREGPSRYAPCPPLSPVGRV